MIKIEIPADNKELAAAIGDALTAYGRGVNALASGIAAAEQATAQGITAAGALTADESKAINELVFDDPEDDTNHGAGDAAIKQIHKISSEINEREDTQGVQFNAEFCGNAADPYYAGGKRKGQWKKRKGVTDAAYDTWYAVEVGQLTRPAPTEPDTAVDTSKAFSNGEQSATTTDVPANAGEFMQWVAEKQAAELLTADNITQAYGQAGVAIPDLFNPATANLAIAAVFAILSDLAGPA